MASAGALPSVPKGEENAVRKRLLSLPDNLVFGGYGTPNNDGAFGVSVYLNLFDLYEKASVRILLFDASRGSSQPPTEPKFISVRT